MLARVLEKRIPRALFGERATRHILYSRVAGKVIGLAILVLAICAVRDVFGHPAYAADQSAHSECVNPLNTIWTLSAAFLVFFMQAGFLFLEVGFARTRETVNVLLGPYGPDTSLSALVTGLLFSCTEVARINS